MTEKKTFSILGIKVHLYNTKQTLDLIKQYLCSSERVHSIATVNLEFIMLAQHNEELKDYVNNVSKLNTIDGVGILNVLKWYGISGIHRVCGSDLAYKIAEICKDNNKKYFILGSAENVSQQAKIKLKELYEGLEVENYSPPYVKSLKFSEDEDKKIMNILREFKPDVVCVAFGVPKEELWIHEHQDFLNEIGVKIAIGLGGSFDFIAGKVNRAPSFFKKTGNEWLYRLIKEPRARFKRQITTIPIYYWLCFLEYIQRGYNEKNSIYNMFK